MPDTVIEIVHRHDWSVTKYTFKNCSASYGELIQHWNHIADNLPEASNILKDNGIYFTDMQIEEIEASESGKLQEL